MVQLVLSIEKNQWNEHVIYLLVYHLHHIIAVALCCRTESLKQNTSLNVPPFPTVLE